MPTRKEIESIKKKNEEKFINRPGITGIATGYKVIGGKKTDELCIRFYVAKKRDVPAKDSIPKKIDNIKTDVIQRRFKANFMKIRVTDLGVMADTGTYDPLRGGISIGPCRVIGGYIFTGTLGLIVRDNTTNNPMLLSNFHVMCVDNGWRVGDTMAQPSRVDGGNCPADVVGTLQRAVLAGTTGVNGPGVDCAISDITARAHECSIVDIGDVAGIATAVEGQAVRKRGRTTGLTFGTVESTDLTVSIDYEDGIGVVTLQDQIGIEVDTSQSTEFGISGDSGSGIINDSRRVVGLYYGGNLEETDDAGNVIVPEGIYGVANPIQAVLDALDVNVCVAPIKKIEKFEKFEKPEKFEKFEKIEKREWKEKYEKPELKDYWEPKQRLEPKEIREPKEYLEPKNWLEPKDIREPKEYLEPKHRLEPKDFMEPKDISEPKIYEPKGYEPKGFDGGPGDPTGRGGLNTRIDKLEAEVSQLTHFINSRLRPDLSSGALKNEPDLRTKATSDQKLHKDAADAKQSKDAKDTEKPCER